MLQDQIISGSDQPNRPIFSKILAWLRRLWQLILTDWRYSVSAIAAVLVVIGGLVAIFTFLMPQPANPPGPIANEQNNGDTETNGNDQPTPNKPNQPDDPTPNPNGQPGGSQGSSGGSGGSSGGGDDNGNNGSGGNSGGNNGGSGGNNGGGGGGNGGSGDCALPKYPTPDCTGVPAGWTPTTTINGDFNVTEAGAVIENYLVTGSISVRAPNVTIRNTRVYGSIMNSLGSVMFGPLLIEDSEVVPPPGQEGGTDTFSAIGESNYPCRRCKVINRIEGWRVSSGTEGSGPVVIEHSYARIKTDPDFCAQFDPHGDGIQGFFGTFATIHHNTIDQRDDPCTTAPIFIADSSEGANITDNVLAGGTYSLRMLAGNFPFVTGNKIVDGEWAFGPWDTLDGTCDAIGTWNNNATVTFNFSTGTVLSQVSALDCP